MENEDGNWITWFVVIGLIWGGYSLFKKDDTPEYKPSSSYTSETYENYEDEEDGYQWAEGNDVSSFEDCQDQFGTSYEQDQCNEYVKENYSGYDSFNGYDCTEDCSGHEAGYNWAEENDISDEYDCDGNSSSFNEGCVSYIEENY